jgi:cyclopropane-fatty-acyl-phospholipid synthase
VARGREAAAGHSAGLDNAILGQLSRALEGVPVELRLWNGETSVVSRPTVATVVIRDRRTLLGLTARPEMTFGEAYRDGRLDVDGDLVALLTAIDRKVDWRRQRPASWLNRLRLGGDRSTARRNVHHHYDLGNAFYRQWLDEQLLYTCAYFPTSDTSLEAAQRAKMDYVCRKAAIRPGDTVFEAGCGWGALALHAARNYGARVCAWNLSTEQVAYARERARSEGLQDRVDFVLDDYRHIEGRCDVFLSIGMLEHVGPRHYRELGNVMDRCLDERHGRGVLHFIGRNKPAPFSAWVRRRIFPGAYAPTLREALEGTLEPFAFAVLDVENLRLHYARTLQHWLERFEGSMDSIGQMFDDRFVRTWRLYLAGSQASFTSGCLELFQVTFARGACNDVPWTRSYLYA